MNPSYDEILKAQSMRGKDVRRTSLDYSPIFSQLTGSEVYLKSEYQQKTGAFKIRGAYYKIKTLTEYMEYFQLMPHTQHLVHDFQQMLQ